VPLPSHPAPSLGAVTDDVLPLGLKTPRPRKGKPPAPLAEQLPVARVVVDTGLTHLDRPFDYAVPQALSDDAQPGVRVRVRFAGRLVDGWLLERAAASDHPGRLTPLTVVSPEQVLTPEVAALARAVADRTAGSLPDVLRLALPPRHARVEAEPAAPPAAPPSAPQPGSWSRYDAGPAFLAALAGGRSPRAVWTALPGPTWPQEVATAVRACAASGRGAVVVVPDGRDLERVAGALAEAGVPTASLSADLGPAERYRRWLSVLRGSVAVAVGTRATAFAPVRDLGLVVVWDDGDDLHAEPRAPYPHVREVLALRAHLAGAAVLVGGIARTAEAQLLVETGWAKSLEPPRAQARAVAPLVEGTSEDQLARDPMAQAARLPALAFDAARAALASGAPVLVQVPRRGYVPSLACARDRTPARCPACAGPLAAGSSAAVPGCRWCGRLAGDWRCPACDGRALRAAVVGAARTAEELGRAFPGTAVRTSGRDGVLATVPGEPAVVVSTPGAEPVADGGYGAVLLLDAWAVLGRADLRAGEEALRRWFAAAALARPAPAGRVVVAADRALPQVQALIRWDPPGAAARELAERRELGFPPAVRMASVTGPPAALAELLATLPEAARADVLGPVPVDESTERLLLRAPRARGAELAAALKAAAGVRSARKADPVRIELDPRLLG
jgi:primosomal protein N' (replication factor Y)